jgi:hypothetical protein
MFWVWPNVSPPFLEPMNVFVSENLSLSGRRSLRKKPELLALRAEELLTCSAPCLL